MFSVLLYLCSFHHYTVLHSSLYQRRPPEDEHLHFISLELCEKRASLPQHFHKSVSCDPQSRVWVILLFLSQSLQMGETMLRLPRFRLYAHSGSHTWGQTITLCQLKVGFPIRTTYSLIPFDPFFQDSLCIHSTFFIF